MIKRLIFTLLIALPCSHALLAQLGGRFAFDFLNLPTNARSAALGSNTPSLRDYDVNMVLSNTAALNSEMDKHLSANVNPYYGGILNSSVVYADSFQNLGRFYGAVQYLNYGKFDETDPLGNKIGTFSAADYALSLGYSNKIGPFALGGAFRIVGSGIAGANAFGVGIDMGSVYTHPENDMNIGLVVRNLGFGLAAYNEGERVNMPLNVQLGMNYKLKHMPLRFLVAAHTLNIADAQYADPNSPVTRFSSRGAQRGDSKVISEQIMRHFSFGGEFVFSKNFFLRIGYNHQRRKEMRAETNTAWAGFSTGCMIRVKTFEFGFTRSAYHAIGATSFITATMNLGNSL
jgi:hypothetical protein